MAKDPRDLPRIVTLRVMRADGSCHEQSGLRSYRQIRQLVDCERDSELREQLLKLLQRDFADCYELELAERDARDAQVQTSRWSANEPSSAIPPPDCDAKWSHATTRVKATNERFLPWNYDATASSFCDWIYDLYFRSTGLPDAAALQRGMDGELAAHRARLQQKKRGVPAPEPRNGWELFFCGIGRPGEFDEGVTSWPASALKVGGQVMRGRPDYIFVHRDLQRVRIVELKFSDARVPEIGWPNHRAQLWVYGQLDIVAELAPSAANVELCGEVWYDAEVDRFLDRKRVRLLWNRTWTMADPRFCGECRELFALFSRRYEETVPLRQFLASRGELHRGMTIEDVNDAGWVNPSRQHETPTFLLLQFGPVELAFAGGTLTSWRLTPTPNVKR